MAPWDWVSDGPVDLQEQADCYQALFEVFQSEPWMEGVFWWAWGTDPDHGGPSDTSYSPHNKPAEAILQYFFASAAHNTPGLFRIERATGNVYTDGAFFPGGADVAEYVTVSEPVEPGDVVEIDPQNPKSYRKARGPYSPLVAGVISTAPGFVLGGKLGAGRPLPQPLPDTERGVLPPSPPAPLPSEGEGSRGVRGLGKGAGGLGLEPGERRLLALLGRVPVKATTENGPIRPGDLLTSASKPGYAMRCASPKLCEGALLGKALQPLSHGDSAILMLVTAH
jgi:hypothetical protein